MKEAVPMVANGLGISRNTVYLHLRSLEKKT
jgi:predicted transcriptional regulator YheO